MTKNNFFSRSIKQLIFVATLFIVNVANAQTKWADWSGSNGFPVGPPSLTSSVLGSGVTSISTSFNNITTVGTDYRINSCGSVNLVSSPYVEFTVNHTATNVVLNRFVLGGLIYNIRPPESGNNANPGYVYGLDLRCSADNYASSLGTKSIPNNFNTNLMSWSLSGVNSTSTSPIIFRLYFYNVNSWLDNIGNSNPFIRVQFLNNFTTNLDVTPATYTSTNKAASVWFTSATVTIPPPTITSFSPASGAVGSTVTITGTGFNTTAANNVVYLGGVKATVTAASATSLTVTIPNGVTTGRFSYTNTGTNLVCYSRKSFGVKFNGSSIYSYSTGNYNAATTFAVTPSILSGGDAFALADFNDDKKVDVAMFDGSASNQKLSVFVNNSTSSSAFSSSNISQTNYVNLTRTQAHPGGLKVADFNGDGLLDIWGAMRGNDPLAISFKNTSTSSSAISFQSQGFIGSFAGYGAALTDFNNDGKIDIFTGYPLDMYALEVYRNTTASPASSLSFNITGPNNQFSGTHSGTSSGISADLNNDGFDDHIASGGRFLNIRRNNSGTSFTAQTAFDCGINNINTIKVYDFDGDGLEDILVSGQTSSIKIYRNTSSGATVSFNTVSPITRSTNNTSSNNGIALADYDDDGKMDVLVSGNDGIDLLINTSSGSTISFANPVRVSNLNESKGLIDLHSVDFNNDGRHDLIGISSSNVVYFPFNVPPTLTMSNNTLGTITNCKTPRVIANHSSVSTDIPVATTDLVFVSNGMPYLLYLNAADGNYYGTNLYAPGLLFSGVTSVSLNQFLTTYAGARAVAVNFPSANPQFTFNPSTGLVNGSLSVLPYFEEFAVSGTNLTADLTVTPPANFQVSTNQTTWIGSTTTPTTLTLTQSGGSVSSTTIFVRTTPGIAANSYSGNITVTTTGATNQTKAVAATILAPTVFTTQATATVNLCQNASYTLAGGNTTGSGTLSRQWFSNTTNSNTGGTSLGSANFAQTGGLQIVTTTPGTYYYYLQVTGSCGTAVSDVTTIVISPTSVPGNASVASASVCTNTSTTLSLTGHTGTIQWQQSANGTSGWANVSGGTGATTDSYTTPNLTTTTFYRAVVTSGGCAAVNSNVVSVGITTNQPFGNALAFDGSGKVQFGNQAQAAVAANFTIEAWVNVPSSASSLLTILSNSPAPNSFTGFKFSVNEWNTSNGLLVLEGSNGVSGGSVSSTVAVTRNVWQHVAVVVNGSSVTFYINGAVAGTATRSFVSSAAHPLTLGAFSDSQYPFRGTMDEVRLWNVSKTQQEIQAAMYGPLVGNETGLVTYFNFNQGTPGGTNTGIANLIDNGPNAFTGSLSEIARTGTAENFVLNSNVMAITGTVACVGSTVQLNHPQAGGTWSSATTSVATINSSGLANCLTAGTSVISYTYTYNGCQFTDTYTMTVNATPVAPTVANTSIAYCQNAVAPALTATAAGSHTLRWYTVATGGTGSTTAITPVTSAAGTFMFYVAQVNASGCEGPRVAITVTVSPSSVAGTATGTATICSGTSTTLSLTGNTGTIQWQQSANGTSGWVNVTGGSGATTVSYTTPNLTATTHYRAVVTSGGCVAANSNVITVTVPPAPYPYDRAVNFTNGGSLVRNTTASLNFTNFTVEAWINPTTFNNWAGIVSKGAFQLMTTNTGTLAILFEEGWSWSWTQTPNVVLTLNRWQHVAASYNASTKETKLYVNGALVHTWIRTQNYVPNFSTGALAIGINNGTGNQPSQPYQRNFIGNIDEVKAWNAVRTDAQILANFATELAGNETGLVAYYKFDQGIGGGNNTAITSLTDLTSNANHLTPTSMTMNGTTNNILQVGPTILNSPSLCLNATPTLAHTISGGSWSTSDASVLSVNSSTGEATANAVGTATITYTFTDNGCTYTSTKLFTVNALPAAPVAPTTVNLCQGITATALTATALTGHTLQWYTAATGGTASTTAPIPPTATLGSTIFYVSQRNNTTGCEGARTAITVTVNEIPTISGVQNMTVGGATLQLTGSGTSDATTPWASSNTAVATISSLGVVTAVGGGTTTITYTNANGCTTTAAIRVVDCAQPFGNALAFGVGTAAFNADFVQVNSRIFPSQTVANFTIETWIRPSASDILSGTTGNTWMAFLGYAGSTVRSPSLYITNNGVLHASWTEGSTLNGTPVTASSPTSLVANKWTHVALVKDGTTARLFVDGIQIHSITCAATINVPDNFYWLGKVDNQFSGSLDEVRFWSTARTQAQIQAAMNTELVGTETGLLTYFDFNQGVAGGTNTGITTVTNKANNLLNGTLTNFTRTGTTSNFVGNSVASFDISGTATICGNSTSQYTHPISGGTWSVSNGAAATVSTSGLLTAIGAETVTLSYAYTINGCSFTATRAITINSPAAPTATTTVNLCQGATATALSATALSGHTLQWYTVATGGTASTTAPTPNTTAAGTFTFWVSQRSNTSPNCESSRTAITVNVNAVPTISGAQSMTVGGATLQLTGSGTPDATTPWTSSNPAAAIVSSTGVVTAVGAGSTIITYTVANGCIATAVISVVDCSQPFGNALQFDGVNDSFSTASNLSALSITGNITIETWIKFDQTHSDYVRLIGKGDATNRTYGLWLGTNGKLLFQIWNSASSGLNLEGITTLQPGVWYHISATRNGNTAKIYINGIEDATTSTTVIPQTNTFPLTVGYGNMHTWLKGALDEVRIWNVARSLSQIQQGMYNALVGNETGLVAYYDFNQGIAGGNNTSIVSTLDRTTNVLHGTLTNFARTGTASNFVGNTTADFAITGAASVCANSTSQYTHPVSGGTWSMSNGAAATISSSGLVTAVGAETITLSYTYTINGCAKTATRALTIVQPVISGATSVGTGESLTLTATTTAASSNAWVSSNTNIATVTPNGVVNGLAIGTTTITYTNNNGCTATQTITVVAGTTQTPVLTSPATNSSSAASLQFSYTLPEAPLAGSVRLTFTPTAGGTPIVWTMSNATSVTFSHVVGTNPTVTNASNVVSGIALPFATYNVTLSYQDAFSNPVAQVTNNNIQTLSPPSISFASATQNAVVNRAVTITTINAGGAATFTISPALPSGLSINSSTGLITGTPTAAMASRQYTVTATNAAGNSTATFNLLIDTDMDGDGDGDATDPDIDGDGIPNTVEIQDGTNPSDPNSGKDTDGDGVPDYVEVRDGTSPTNPADARDTDGDGVPDHIELRDGTSPTNPADAKDTDGDGVPDYIEVRDGTSPTNPADAKDTDGDGVPDYVEVRENTSPTNPADAKDTDGDGVPDHIERRDGTSPTNPADGKDTDGDGVPDYVERRDGTSPTTPGDAKDTDGDGVPDYIEVRDGTSPTNPADGKDTDGDGVPDYVERRDGTSPTNPADAKDTDGDGVPDHIERRDGTSPTTPGDGKDTDGDGVPDYVEVRDGTSPTNPADARDTDGDGMPDYYEAKNTAPTNINISSSSINENNAVNAVVGTLSSADLGEVTPHTYTLVSGVGATDNASFNILNNTLRAGVAFDFETKSSYSVRVRTTDRGGLSFERAFTITVLDVVENVSPTNINISSSSINENNAVNAVVGTLSSTDADAGDTHTYTLVAGSGSTDNASFNVLNNQLRAGVAFNFETKTSYSVRVRTTDAGGLSFEKVFTITVNNVNEAPTDVALSANSVAENVAVNTVVGSLSTTDVDAGNTFTYTLVSGTGSTDNAAFNISGNSLRLSVSPDFETKSSYSVRVRTTDQDGLSFEKVFTITVNNVNEAPTDVALSASSVAENVAVNTVVGSLSTTDVDAGNTFTYTLVSGTGSTDNAAFNISGNSLRLSVSPDFETKSSYSVRVRTTDQDGLSFEKVFTINVTNVNEAPTDVALSANSVAENVAVNTVVGSLSTTDVDAGNTFTYTLVSGTGSTDNAAFNISGNSLRLSVSPDFETKSSYSVRVRTTDQDGLSFEKVFTINVTNVNEAPSNIALSNANIFEGNAVGMGIGNLSSTDQDAANTFSYSLVSGDVSAFSIAGNTLRANMSFNFATKSSYSVRVRTTDQGGLSFERDFTVSISQVPVIMGTGNQVGTNIPTGASTTPEISKGFSSQLSVIGSGYTSYSWSPATGLSSTSIANPVARPLRTTTYTLTVTNAFGNSTSTSITVVVNEDYYTTSNNILTPNGDGQNDTWVVENLSNYANHEVKIFDRTGRLLYSTRNYQNNWNGELNGTMLAQGTYYYTITFGPNIAPKKGFITLIR